MPNPLDGVADNKLVAALFTGNIGLGLYIWHKLEARVSKVESAVVEIDKEVSNHKLIITGFEKALEKTVSATTALTEAVHRLEKAIIRLGNNKNDEE